jgi:aldehyde dehydrogenase (NAD+)
MTTNTVTSIQQEALLLLEELGVQVGPFGDLSVHTPITGEVIARVRQDTAEEAAAAIKTAHQAHLEWRMVPAPKRGELVRIFGEELRASSCPGKIGHLGDGKDFF